MEISFHSHLESNRVIATKFCTWHDSCAVVACGKICRDLMASNGITARRSFHRIWIAGKKTLVKRGPGPTKHTQYLALIGQLSWCVFFNIWGEYWPSYNGTALYSSRTGSIQRMLMPWLLASPGHQQPCYWPCKICRSMSSIGKDFNYLLLHHLSAEKWWKKQT